MNLLLPYLFLASFLPIEQVVNPNLLRKDLVIDENLVLPEWMEQALANDLAVFGSYCREDLATPFSDEYSSCAHFRIREGQLEAKIPPLFQNSFQQYKIDAICVAIYRLMHAKGLQLKDGDFLIYLKDGAGGMSSPYPVLCFAKEHDSNCILMPDWFSLSNEMLSIGPNLLRSVFQQKGDVMQEVMKGDQKYPWPLKHKMAFWRGGAHGTLLENNALWKTNPRAALVLFSMGHHNLVFARFLNTRFFGVCGEMRELEPQLCAPWISPMESCLYKYQIDVDGWASGYHRCQWVLRSHCVPLKQVSSYIQWYYAGLKPYVHYVPYLSDCSDLEETIHWLRENDDIAHEIAIAGQQFAEKYLNEEMTYLYLYEVLKRVLEKCTL